MKRAKRVIRLSTVVASALVLGLAVSSVMAQVVRQVTNELTTAAGPGAMDDSGAVVFTGTSSNFLGTNPEHAFQILRIDPVTGVPAEVTSARKGVSILVSTSDDARYVAFPSPSDLTGGNHDESIELFVLDTQTDTITQLTDDPAPNAGSVSVIALSGDGSRAAFVANTDPRGTNPDNVPQLFIVDRQGTGLRQLTQATDGGFSGVTISDDATRIAFTQTADLTGGNPDGGTEVFAIMADGTGLRQLTNSALGFDSGSPSLSGDGTTIAFQSNADLTGGNAVHQDEIFAIDWDGTNLQQLTTTSLLLGLTGDPAAMGPSITDDGQAVVFYSNHSTLFPIVNVDGNFEIFRVARNGTGRTALTNSILEVGSLLPIVSGSGNRITYYGIDTEVSLRAIDGAGGGQIDLLSFDLIFNESADITPDGTRAVFVRSQGLFATGEVWRVESDGTDPFQVTSLPSGSPSSPSIAGDRNTIVFSSSSDPLGANGDGSGEVFLILADGTGLEQLTSGLADTSSSNPVISSDGSIVVFDSDADLTGGNLDTSREIFAVRPGEGGPVQLTDGILDSTSRLPRVDGSGTWVTFESNADLLGTNADGSLEVFRIRTDGGGLEQITNDALLDSVLPDISSDAERIVFNTASDPLGTNPDGNSEVFAYEPAITALRQLTSSVDGASGGARVSGDGSWVYFTSTAPIFEADPDEPLDLYRVSFVGDVVQRVGALRAATSSFGPIPFGGGGGLAPNGSGELGAFSGLGDFTGRNLDGLSEIWIIDRATRASFEVGKTSPTVLSWDAGSGPVRYDAIRGDVSQLGSGAGGDADLGPVVCLEDDSPDNDTVGFGDDVVPQPGQALFFLYRGSQGLDDGPGSYGAATNGADRTPASGDCAE